MVDNFMSAGTNGDAEDELPAPYGTGPKNRTTEDQHRSDYGYTERSGDGGWRERSTALDGLDPAPSLPNAPRSYDRGPVPQQPYVPKPPFLSDRDYPAASGGYPVADPSTYGDSPPWGEPETHRESGGYEESPFAPRPGYPDRPQTPQDRAPQDRAAQERAAQERAAQERAAQERATQERAVQERAVQERVAQERAAQERATQERATQERVAQERAAQERAAQERSVHERAAQERQALERQQQERYQERGFPEQPSFRQPPPGPPQQAQQNPFSAGRNGTSGPPPNRPTPPATPPGAAPGGPPPPPPRPGTPGPTGNGLTPHTANGAPSSNGWTQAESRTGNGLSAPTPPPSPGVPPSSNGLRSSNGLGSSGVNSVAASNTAPGTPPQNNPAAPGTGPGNGAGAGNSGGNQGPANRPGPGGQGPTGWTGTAPTPASAPPASASSSSNGYPSDPSAEYESNAPLSSAPAASSSQESSQRPAGARRRADVQQDAPSQVQQDAPISSHRAARRAQASPAKEETVAETNAPKETSKASAVSNSIGSDGGGSALGSAGGSSTASDATKRPRRYRIHHLRDMKNRGEKWAMLTAYDQYTAEIFDQAGIPVLLVGDSAANNVFGYESTLRVTVDELIPLARAVAGAVDRALVVADLPFGSYQASPEQAFHTAVRFMKEAGVHAVKLEGGRNVVPAVEKLTQSGIPVMAHIGFTPQSEHTIGGYRVQGRGDQAAALIDDAVALAEAGAFSVVLEMVPGDVSAEITKRVSIPTIGIGAGRDTDAQVLVWQDMAGMRSGQMPRFVKQYADLRGILTNAAATFAAEVSSGGFPTDDHTF